MRALTRTIVTSHTYRQASLTNAALEEKDPYNRLLARQSRFRVDAEVVHDIALSVSGLLVEKFGGPSVKPVQPDGYYAARTSLSGSTLRVAVRISTAALSTPTGSGHSSIPAFRPSMPRAARNVR